MPKKVKTREPPRSRDDLRPVDKAFIHTVMFEMGVLPIEDPTLDMRVPLKQLTPEEARVLKRKFRKLWRKCMKAQLADGGVSGKAAKSREDQAKAKLGVGKHVPSRAERLARKRLVYERVWNEVIVPMLIRFENPERDAKVGDSKIKEG